MHSPNTCTTQSEIDIERTETTYSAEGSVDPATKSTTRVVDLVHIVRAAGSINGVIATTIDAVVAPEDLLASCAIRVLVALYWIRLALDDCMTWLRTGKLAVAMTAGDSKYTYHRMVHSKMLQRCASCRL